MKLIIIFLIIIIVLYALKRAGEAKSTQKRVDHRVFNKHIYPKK